MILEIAVIRTVVPTCYKVNVISHDSVIQT